MSTLQLKSRFLYLEQYLRCEHASDPLHGAESFLRSLNHTRSSRHFTEPKVSYGDHKSSVSLSTGKSEPYVIFRNYLPNAFCLTKLKCNITDQVSVAVTLHTCVREVFGWNLGPDAGYPDWDLNGLPWWLQAIQEYYLN
jgi:hypothetical protein